MHSKYVQCSDPVWIDHGSSGDLFHKLNPFSPTKTQKQKMMTIQLWIKVIIGTLPAMIVGLLLNDWIEAKMSNAYVVAFMLILYGILFIVIENINAKENRG